MIPRALALATFELVVVLCSIVARYLVPFVPLWWVTSWAWAAAALDGRAVRTQAGHASG